MPSAAADPAARSFVSKTHHDTYDFIKPRKIHQGSRRVLISGASKGIGQAIAVAYARAGYSHIALLARSSVADTVASAKKAAELEGHAPPQFLELIADLSSRADIDAAALETATAFGSLDILVNNAGYLENWTPIVDSDPDVWWKTWEVNVRGTYLMNRAFVPLLLKGHEKTTIAVTSVGAWVTMSGGSAYQGTKTAQVRMNSHLTAEYGDQGLLAYAVHPGNVKTNLAFGMPDYMHQTLQDEPGMAADTIVWLTQERRLWYVLSLNHELMEPSDLTYHRLADRYISCVWDMEELLARKEKVVAEDLLKLTVSR
ncbi:hypothetical protein H2200_005594 [Cladophialophora chaetospira]|uniref:Uncharacterized protein n=1 Tax=Cladophialophora chaetospira TaxID=386627 RepID=A0AA39CJR5_9EURO|nr:hypothetical protein H2200_005594 [Cladophialophora chaetospira]